MLYILAVVLILIIVITISRRKHVDSACNSSKCRSNAEVPTLDDTKALLDIGVRNGEYILCPHCKCENRVGNGSIRTEIICEACGKAIKLSSREEARYQEEVKEERALIYESFRECN